MFLGSSLAVQWLGHHVLTAKSIGSICGWGTKILLATQCGQKKKKFSINVILSLIFFSVISIIVQFETP